ncbi:MAG TPA: hypothetical protein P5572_16920 [Phycisphaerae bacterium]|nr:hypothetical protein [Phycisphaerales bacterium]HRX86709.1 hypothetical protein [Phycisphaerae bacterium]
MKLSPETRRDLRLLVMMLAAAGAIAAVSWLLLPPARTGSAAAQPSTFFNEPYGTKAAYLTLNKLRYSAIRLRRPIDTDTLADIDALVLLEPVKCLHPHEAQTLKSWVADGHRLLVAPRTLEEYGPDCRVMDNADDCVETVDWFRFAERAAKAGDAKREFVDLHPAADGGRAWLPDVAAVRVGTAHRFDPDAPLSWPEADLPITPLLADEDGLVAFAAEYGEGWVFALADIYALTNAGLREADDPIWLADLATALADGDADAVIAVDEYHQGFPYNERPWMAMLALLWDERWGWTVLQVAVVSALGLYAAGRHFGRPEGLVRRVRRTQGEFTAAAGRLLHQARAGDVALATIWRHDRDRLRRALHLPVNCTDGEISDQLARQGHAEAARAVQAAAQQVHQSRLPDATLLELVRRLNTAVEAVEHGTGSRRRVGAQREA